MTREPAELHAAAVEALTPGIYPIRMRGRKVWHWGHWTGQKWQYLTRNSHRSWWFIPTKDVRHVGALALAMPAMPPDVNRDSG